MAVFPMFIELEEEICLIIGGGRVALRKAETLLDMGAYIHIISCTFVPEIRALEAEGGLECHEVSEGTLSAAVWLETHMKKEGIGKAAMLGAPLMNDFAVISLSDLMTPYEQIMKRVRCAAEGDFVLCLYNPKSRKRQEHLAEAVDVIRRYRPEETPVGLVHKAGRADGFCEITTLDGLKSADVDMFTTVIIGNSMTYVRDGKMITPRGYSLEEV